MTRRRNTTSSIPATRPIFPSYLLPPLTFLFHRRKSTPPSAVSPPPPSAAAAAAASSPARRLSRTSPDTLRCRACSTDIGLASQIISKGFTGRHGRAFLVAPPPAPGDRSLLNIRVGRSEDRQLVTGWHVVADISCATCGGKLGWKYVDAREQPQRYKVGKYILETARVVTYRGWEDVAVEDVGCFGGGEDGGVEATRRAGRRSPGGSTSTSSSGSDEIVFDSEDEEECEHLFAGTWDAGAVAKRRSQMLARKIAMVG